MVLASVACILPTCIKFHENIFNGFAVIHYVQKDCQK